MTPEICEDCGEEHIDIMSEAIECAAMEIAAFVDVREIDRAVALKAHFFALRLKARAMDYFSTVDLNGRKAMIS